MLKTHLGLINCILMKSYHSVWQIQYVVNNTNLTRDKIIYVTRYEKTDHFEDLLIFQYGRLKSG